MTTRGLSCQKKEKQQQQQQQQQQQCRSQWPRGLRRRSSAAHMLRSWVRIPPRSSMFVCCECCLLSGIGLYDELITRPEDSYRLWCIVIFDLETAKIFVNEDEANAHQGAIGPREKILVLLVVIVLLTAIVLSLGGSSPNTSTEKNK